MKKENHRLSPKKRYLQIALNSTLEEAYRIISQIPISDRILIEAGTPFIKRYGEQGIRKIKLWYEERIRGESLSSPEINTDFNGLGPLLFQLIVKKSSLQKKNFSSNNSFKQAYPYVVADLKMMDRGGTEVEIAAQAGVDAAVALGHASIESLNAFIEKCEALNIDSMIDMMNVEYPLAILRKLRKTPRVVILHRGVDEERFNKEKQIPLHEIRRIKGSYNILVSIAGGDTIRDVQRAIFNDADIVVVWKSFFHSDKNTAALAEQFLKEIK